MTTPPENFIATKTVRRRTRLSSSAWIGLVIIILLFTTVAFPTIIVIFVGMMPTLACYIIDPTPGRYAFRCVASMNFAGVAPFLRQLWTHGHDISSAMDIIGDPFSWLVFYGAAAFGWGLFFSVPGVVSAVKTLSAERRVNSLRSRQNELAEEWGTVVTGENWKPHEISGLSEPSATD